MQLKTQCIINFFHCKHGWSSSTHGRHIKLAVITRFTIPAASSILTYFSYFVTSLLHDFCRQVSRRGKATRNHGFQNSHHENQQMFLTQQTVLFTCSQVAQAITMGPGTTLADRVVHYADSFLILKKMLLLCSKFHCYAPTFFPRITHHLICLYGWLYWQH